MQNSIFWSMLFILYVYCISINMLTLILNHPVNLRLPPKIFHLKYISFVSSSYRFVPVYIHIFDAWVEHCKHEIESIWNIIFIYYFFYCKHKIYPENECIRKHLSIYHWPDGWIFDLFRSSFTYRIRKIGNWAEHKKKSSEEQNVYATLFGHTPNSQYIYIICLFIHYTLGIRWPLYPNQ